MSKNVKLEIINSVKQVSNIAVLSLKAELIKQNHVLTNKLLNSIVSVVEDSLDIITSIIEMEDYGFIVNAGVSAARVPYQRGSGARSSKYIKALIDFFQKKKGLNIKNARSAAFATANVHKKEGIPTRNSYSFSKNGKRLGFITDGLAKIEGSINDIMEKNIDNKIFDFYLQELSKITT